MVAALGPAILLSAVIGLAAEPASEDPWQALLHARVTERGGVTYGTIGAEDRARLDRVLAQLAAQDIAKLDRDRAVAFWLNAYHAMVLAAVVQGERPTTMAGRARMYHWFHKPIAGYRLTLDDVRFILNGFASKDPLIHLAIYDATRSGPGLAREPYRAEELDAQLVAATRRFVNDPAKVRVDAASGRIGLSKILEWYRADFERDAGTMPPFLRQYAEREELVRALAQPVVGTESLPFDWRLDATWPETPG